MKTCCCPVCGTGLSGCLGPPPPFPGTMPQSVKTMDLQRKVWSVYNSLFGLFLRVFIGLRLGFFLLRRRENVWIQVLTTSFQLLEYTMCWREEAVFGILGKADSASHMQEGTPPYKGWFPLLRCVGGGSFPLSHTTKEGMQHCPFQFKVIQKQSRNCLENPDGVIISGENL